MDGAAGIREPHPCRLAQSVRTAMPQASRIALLTEPISKTGGLEGLAEFGDQECQVVPRRVGEDRLQLRHDGDVQLGAGLLLLDVDRIDQSKFRVPDLADVL